MNNQSNPLFFHRWIPTVVGVIIVILIGGGVIAYQQWFTPRPVELPTAGEKEEVVPPEEEQPDQTADWKTYRNENFGFEIKYPTYMNLIPGVDTSGQINEDFGINSDNILEWMNSVNNKCQIGLAVGGWGPPFNWAKEEENFYISGEKYKRVIWEKDAEVIWINTVFKKDNREFTIDLKPPVSGFEECLLTYNQILSTFRFLD